MTFISVFDLQSRVAIDARDNDQGIIATITAISFSANHVEYKCEWFDNRCAQYLWVDEFRLSEVD